jgi:hypothetical protein
MTAAPFSIALRFWGVPQEFLGAETTLERLEPWAGRPFHEWRDVHDELVADDEVRSHRIAPEWSGKRTAKWLKRWSRYDCQVTLSEIGLAALKFLEAEGRYPDDVARLIPTYLPRAPVDPLNGERFGALSVEGGVAFYSTGTDRRRVESLTALRDDSYPPRPSIRLGAAQSKRKE